MSTSPSSLSIKERVSSRLQVPVNSDDRLKVPFGMAPADIWEIPTKQLPLIAKAVLVGLTIAAKGQGSIRTSHSVIAKLCGVSRATVVKGLSMLVKAGLIQRGDPIKQMERYTLLHPRLNPSKYAEAPASAPVAKAKRELPKCIRCGKKRKALGAMDTCRTCHNEIKTRRIVREEIADRLRETA